MPTISRHPQAGQVLAQPMPSTLARAVQAAMLTMGVSAMLGLAVPAHAQTAADQATAAAGAAQSLQVPAGPLPAALVAFASQTGVSVSGTPELVSAVQSPGVNGALPIAQALQQLLAGTGLEAVPAGARSYVLRKRVAATQAPVAGEMLLAPVIVQAQADRVAASEHTGSYTTAESNTATRMGLSLRETPQSVTVITRQQMDDQGLSNLPEILDKVTGFTVGRNDSERATFYSRGFTVENFQFDGMPNTMDSANQYTTSLADSAIYDRVEVVKGATGLLTGAGNPGAVVNLVRKRPTKAFQASVEGGVGSWRKQRGVADVAGPLNADGSVRARMVAAAQNADSHVDYYSRDTRNLYGIVEADLAPRTTAALGIDYMQTRANGASYGHLPLFFSDGGQTHFPTSLNPATRWSYWNNDSTNLFADLKHVFDNGWKLELAGSHLRQSRDVQVGVAAYGQLDPVTGQGINRLSVKIPTTSTTDSLNAVLSGPFELLGRSHELTLGAGWSRGRRGAPGYTSSYDPVDNYFEWQGYAPEPQFDRISDRNARLTEKGAFGAVRLRPTDALSVILGARVSWYRLIDGDTDLQSGVYTLNDRLQVSHKVIPYAGVVYDFSKQWSVYASYTDIFNPQTYYKDAGGTALPPLTGKSKEIGIKAALLDGKLNTSVALFHTQQTNAAQYVDSNPATGEEIYIAAKGVKSRGVEMEVSGQITPAWNLYAGYTYRESTLGYQPDVILSAVNTNQPKHLVKLSTSYRLPGQWKPVTVGGSLSWQSETYYQQAGDQQWRATQPAYTLLGLMARWEVDSQLSLALNLSNVLNKTYMPGMGSYGTGVYGDPRSVYLSARYQF
ncbi:outer membrane receptor for ferric coprogen and ferric-rhodotorulic acid [Comamonas sp. BIGb0152]|uniref:TonB-dependent siderophore receptor n=1 Tax=Comamonas sp. BIGb0152 TaxID=2940601 RepID=UPI002166E264|nr:TonB-dependent receptor [Comamonas sp. BIGb0152]MCS4292668.1 outer membrane receptor for ferric coprogen and ferric-rhodotorulic acid [Comamonas sp. BIGb0152]